MSCRANTREGRPCRGRALAGQELCRAHAGGEVGRPSKLTDELERRLCDALRAGNRLEAAAHYAGISRATLQRWLALGESEQAPPRLRAFAQAVAKARADAEVHAVGVVRKAIGQGDARIALAFLERAYPEVWGRRSARPEPSGEAASARGSDADLDLANPEARRLFSELLRRRPSARPR